MKISVMEPQKLFMVESDSGKTYHITYAGSGDADPDYVSLWKCDCPAGKHGRDCKHLTAFLSSRLMDYHDPYIQGSDELDKSITIGGK